MLDDKHDINATHCFLPIVEETNIWEVFENPDPLECEDADFEDWISSHLCLGEVCYFET